MGRLREIRFSFLLWIGGILLGLPGCLYQVQLDPVRPPALNLSDFQPIAVLPAPDGAGHPGSGGDLTGFLRDALQKKGYTVIDEGEVWEALRELNLSPLVLISSPESLTKLGDRLNAKLVLLATFPEYRVQSSSWGSQNVPVAAGGGPRQAREDLSLPTYFFGRSQIRIVLRIFEVERGTQVWLAEGRIRAPGESAGSYGQRLAERLVKELPPAGKAEK